MTQGTPAPCRHARLMSVIFPMEFILSPKITYVLFENNMPRRIYTDGRRRPSDPRANLRPLFDRQMDRAIGRRTPHLSADGHLMPAKKGQAPPDLRYFNQSRK